MANDLYHVRKGNTKSLLALLFSIGIILLSQPLMAGATDGLAPCVVFLMQDAEAEKDVHIGSGFLVRTEDEVYLVTASHISKVLSNKWRIIMPGAEGKAVVIHVSNATWHTSQEADVSVVELAPSDPEQLKSLLNRSLPLHLLSARPLPPSRDIPLVVMGYPLGLGVSGYVSPLSIETRAVSGFITLQRSDNKKPATFILLQDPSIGGLSGGPVFDTGKSYFEEGRKLIAREGVSVVGIIHGVISDKTGGKLAAVTPADEIVKLLPREKEGE